MKPSRSAGALFRRDSARHTVVANQATLAWWQGTELHPFKVSLENISQSGALLAVAEDLSPPIDVCLKIDSPRATEWVHATVIGTSTSHQKKLFRAPTVTHFLRLKFNPACPFDFFKAATHGESINEHLKEHVSREFDSRTWR